MHLVIHVGPHKTGTSYIQNRIIANRALLAERGWIYPEAGTHGTEGHHQIAHEPEIFLDQPDHPESIKLLESAKAAAAANHGMLISAEGFRYWMPKMLARLAIFLGASQVDLVYAVRCPYSVFYSYWAEEVKHGKAQSLTAKAMEDLIDPVSSPILNPFIDLERINETEQFAVSLGCNISFRMNLLYFDAARKRGIDLCDVITDQIMQAGVLAPFAVGSVNEGWPIERTEFLRLLTFRNTRAKFKVISDAFRLAFHESTTKDERKEIVTVLKTHAQDAFNALALPRDNAFYNDLRARLASADFHRKIPEDGHLDLPDTPLIWRMGDIGMLMMVPEVVALVEKYEERMKQLGF